MNRTVYLFMVDKSVDGGAIVFDTSTAARLLCRSSRSLGQGRCGQAGSSTGNREAATGNRQQVVQKQILTKNCSHKLTFMMQSVSSEVLVTGSGSGFGFVLYLCLGLDLDVRNPWSIIEHNN